MKITFNGETIFVEEPKEKEFKQTPLERKVNLVKNKERQKKKKGHPEGTHSVIDDYSFKEHFGWPEDLKDVDLDDDGVQNLVNAIVKSAVDDIMDYEILRLNNWRDMYRGDCKVPNNYILRKKEIRDKAIYDLYRPEFRLYLGDIEPDSIMRRIKPEAVRLIRQYKDNKAQKARKEKKDGKRKSDEVS